MLAPASDAAQSTACTGGRCQGAECIGKDSQDADAVAEVAKGSVEMSMLNIPWLQEILAFSLSMPTTESAQVGHWLSLPDGKPYRAWKSARHAKSVVKNSGAMGTERNNTRTTRNARILERP